MFDLQSSLKTWRRGMRGAGLKKSALLDELEGHMLDQIEELTTAGLSLEEAFRSAVLSIGSPRELEAEFEKVRWSNEERRRDEGRIWFLALLGSFTLGLSAAILLVPDISVEQRGSGMAAIITLPGLAFVGRAVLGAIAVPRFKFATLTGAGLLAVAWVCLHAWRLRYDEILFGESLAVLLWAACPAYGFMAGVQWGIQAAMRRHFDKTKNPILC